MAKRKPEPVAKQPEFVVTVEFDPEHEWRVRMLMSGGFTKHQAFRLSLLPGIDYRTAVRMREAGADFHTIYDILS